MTWTVIRMILALVVAGLALHPATSSGVLKSAVVVLAAGLITVLAQELRRRHSSEDPPSPLKQQL